MKVCDISVTAAAEIGFFEAPKPACFITEDQTKQVENDQEFEHDWKSFLGYDDL